MWKFDLHKCHNVYNYFALHFVKFFAGSAEYWSLALYDSHGFSFHHWLLALYHCDELAFHHWLLTLYDIHRFSIHHFFWKHWCCTKDFLSLAFGSLPSRNVSLDCPCMSEILTVVSLLLGLVHDICLLLSTLVSAFTSPVFSKSDSFLVFSSNRYRC